MLLTLQHLMVQIRDILTSDDANVVLIYKWYCLNSFFCLFLFSLAAWKPRLPYLSFIAFVLTTLRAEVRMLDLELSHQTNFVYWFTICVYNTASVIVNMFILTTHFKYKKATMQPCHLQISRRLSPFSIWDVSARASMQVIPS